MVDSAALSVFLPEKPNSNFLFLGEVGADLPISSGEPYPSDSSSKSLTIFYKNV